MRRQTDRRARIARVKYLLDDIVPLLQADARLDRLRHQARRDDDGRHLARSRGDDVRRRHFFRAGWLANWLADRAACVRAVLFRCRWKSLWALGTRDVNGVERSRDEAGELGPKMIRSGQWRRRRERGRESQSCDWSRQRDPVDSSFGRIRVRRFKLHARGGFTCFVLRHLPRSVLRHVLYFNCACLC